MLRLLPLAAMLLWSYQPGAVTPPGSALHPGMTLVYESDGKPQPEWTVLAVTTDPAPKPSAACAIVQIRRGPAPSDPPPLRLCAEDGMLLQWSDAQQAWQSQRPILPARTLTLKRPNGETIVYETGEASEALIGQRTVPVVSTTVTTLDASSRPIRRLRERYAPSLTTAVEGEFAVADASASSGFRVTQRFVLREIR